MEQSSGSLLRTALPFVLNMSASVALIAVNKALMSTHGFVWGAQSVERQVVLLRLFSRYALRVALHHHSSCGETGQEKRRAACSQHSPAWYAPVACMHIQQPQPTPELALFVVAANSSVAALNISLKLNSVGLYQVRLDVFTLLFLQHHILNRLQRSH
jgi:steroid 5-alpha reductase family enzyme